MKKQNYKVPFTEIMTFGPKDSLMDMVAPSANGSANPPGDPLDPNRAPSRVF